MQTESQAYHSLQTCTKHTDQGKRKLESSRYSVGYTDHAHSSKSSTLLPTWLLSLPTQSRSCESLPRSLPTQVGRKKLQWQKMRLMMGVHGRPYKSASFAYDGHGAQKSAAHPVIKFASAHRFFLPARLPSPFLGGPLPRRFNAANCTLRLHARKICLKICMNIHIVVLAT